MLVTLPYPLGYPALFGSSNSDICKSILALLESFLISLRLDLLLSTELYYLLLLRPPLFEDGAIY